MKKLVLLLTLFICGSVFAQSAAKSTQEVLNYNYNAGRFMSDTLRVTTTIDTVVLTGKAYNLIVWPIDGDVTMKLSNDSRYWPHWMTIAEDNIITFSGGDIDSLFLKSAGAVNTNIIYTSF